MRETEAMCVSMRVSVYVCACEQRALNRPEELSQIWRSARGGRGEALSVERASSLLPSRDNPVALSDGAASCEERPVLLRGDNERASFMRSSGAHDAAAGRCRRRMQDEFPCVMQEGRKACI